MCRQLPLLTFDRSVKYARRKVNGKIKQLCLILGLSAFSMTGCGGTPPQNPPANAVAWKVYSNPVVGYALEHPDLYETEEDYDGRTLVLRYNGAIGSLGGFSGLHQARPEPGFSTKEGDPKRGIGRSILPA